MLSVWVSSLSAPSMEIRMSSPRVAKICSLSTRNRSLAVSVPRCTSAFRSVGRMPIITTRVPVPRAFSSPALRSSLTTCSRSASASPASRRGGTLISRLNCPTSTPQAGFAIASSTSALRMDGMCLGVDEVQLDLLAHLRRVVLERILPQHPGERVKRAPHLLPVQPPVLTAELDRLNLTAHEASAQPPLAGPWPGQHPLLYTFACPGGPSQGQVARRRAVSSRTHRPSRPRRCAMNLSCSWAG